MHDLTLFHEKLPAAVVLVSVLFGAAIDFRRFRLPNMLTLPLVVTGICWHTATGGLPGLVLSLIGMTAAAFPPLLMFARGGMGAGDVKLMAGIGAWMGWLFSMHVLIAAGLLGGIFSMVANARRGRTSAAAVAQDAAVTDSVSDIGKNQQYGAPDLIETALSGGEGHARLLPFGVMIAIGTVILLVIPVDSLRVIS